jgi:pimeloyl-ACP methyl ester carboxylesterase
MRVRIVALAVAAALVLIGSPAGAGAVTAGNPRQGKFSGLISIGGARKLFMRCAGRGGPTVIMEAGIHGSSDTWTVFKPGERSVFQDVARFTHVCAYDRPGTQLADGRLSPSTPVPMPRTLPDMAADLHRLLISAGLRSPVVLVGHSLAGLILRYFAQTYRKEVRGMVFVDALGSSIASLLGPVWWPRYARLVNFPLGPSFPYPRGWETVDLIGAIRAVQRATPPRMPLAVISHTVPFHVYRGCACGPIIRRLNKAWPIMQDREVSLEPQTPHILATGSSHSVDTYPPDLLASVIRLIWDRARARR